MNSINYKYQNSTILFTAIVLFILFSSCRKPKIVEVDLPVYANEMVVEGYLIPDQPYLVSLTESVGYLENPEIPFIKDALVYINHGSTSDTLIPFEINLNGILISFYTSKPGVVMTRDYNTPYTLNVEDTLANGTVRKAFCTTQLLPPVEVDSIEFRFDQNPQKLAYMLVYYQDASELGQYYRFIAKNSPMSVYTPEVIRDTLIDFTFEDKIINGQYTPIGTNYRYEPKDTVSLQFLTITKEYFDFLRTLQDATNSNGNPFIEPLNVKGNVSGAKGIFTAYEILQYTPVVPE